MSRDDDTYRRLARLRLRRTLESKSDEYLMMLLDDAREYFLTTTHRAVDPGESVDGLITNLAVIYSNKEGAEGNSKAEDGDLKREWSESIPADIQKQIKAWRLIPGIHAVLDL